MDLWHFWYKTHRQCLQVWSEAIRQAFYSLSVGLCPIVVLSSHNRFNHDIHRWVIVQYFKWYWNVSTTIWLISLFTVILIRKPFSPRRDTNQFCVWFYNVKQTNASFKNAMASSYRIQINPFSFIIYMKLFFVLVLVIVQPFFFLYLSDFNLQLLEKCQMRDFLAHR